MSHCIFGSGSLDASRSQQYRAKVAVSGDAHQAKVAQVLADTWELETDGSLRPCQDLFRQEAWSSEGA